MSLFCELLEYHANCNQILCHIKRHGPELQFESWFYGGDKFKINNEFVLRTPELYFEIVKYNVLLVGETRYRFTLHRETDMMSYPKNRKLFNVLFAPIIFKTCMNQYKKTGKQK